MIVQFSLFKCINERNKTISYITSSTLVWLSCPWVVSQLNLAWRCLSSGHRWSGRTSSITLSLGQHRQLSAFISSCISLRLLNCSFKSFNQAECSSSDVNQLNEKMFGTETVVMLLWRAAESVLERAYAAASCSSSAFTAGWLTCCSSLFHSQEVLFSPWDVCVNDLVTASIHLQCDTITLVLSLLHQLPFR